MIFVTGGTGLVGSHLIFELIRRNYDVRALVRNNSSLSVVKRVFSYYSSNPDYDFKKIKWIEGDILDFELLLEGMAECDAVYHVAAMVSFNPRNRQKVISANILGTKNIVNAALKTGINRVAYVSSVAALGRSSDGEEVDENTLWSRAEATSIYSFSKFHAEMEIWRGIAEGLDAVIINPTVILGPGKWYEGSSVFFKTIHHWMPFYPPGINGFVDVRDVVNCLILLMEKNIVNEKFIINSENLPYKLLFELIAQYFGKKKPVFHIPPLLSFFAWRIEKIRSLITRSEPLITKEIAYSGHSKAFYSNQKIINALQYKFISVEECIIETCQLFLTDIKNREIINRH